jgi:hypothetical protein
MDEKIDGCDLALIELCDEVRPEADNDWFKPDIMALAFNWRGELLLDNHGARWAAEPFGDHRRRAYLPRDKIEAIETAAVELAIVIGFGCGDIYEEDFMIHEWTANVRNGDLAKLEAETKRPQQA